MSDLDKKALDANFQGWKQERAPDEDEGIAFEWYTIEQVLKDFDLSDDDIDFGSIGGPDDGGVDGMYFFVDRKLFQLDDPPPTNSQDAELVLIQSKRSGGFSENVVDRIHGFLRDTLEWDTPVDDLVHLNSAARDCIASFRDTFARILQDAPRVRVTAYYAALRFGPLFRHQCVILVLHQGTVVARLPVSPQLMILPGLPGGCLSSRHV